MRTIDEIISAPQPRPVVIAHRGASNYFHENTMEAFEAAVDMRAEMMEFDVRCTADNALVIHHDPDINGNVISKMTLEETREAASDVGFRIPTLIEVLDHCNGKLLLDIELKEAGYEEQALNMVLDILSPDHFIISSTLDSVLMAIYALNPAIKTGLIIESRPRWQLLSKLYPGRRVQRAGVDVLVVSQKLLKVNILSTTSDLGLPIWVYTVNERHDLWKVIKEEKVSGVFTDRPDVALLLRDLHAAGQKSAPGIEEPEKPSGNGVSG